jgi:hypothetical protein
MKVTEKDIWYPGKIDFKFKETPEGSSACVKQESFIRNLDEDRTTASFQRGDACP